MTIETTTFSNTPPGVERALEARGKSDVFVFARRQYDGKGAHPVPIRLSAVAAVDWFGGDDPEVSPHGRIYLVGGGRLDVSAAPEEWQRLIAAMEAS